jgi:hypothetical protein
VKTRITRVHLWSAVFLMSMSISASAGEKYVSTEFGFAASFPAAVIRKEITPGVATFDANAPGGKWEAQVNVIGNVAMPKEVTHEVMENKLAEYLKDHTMTQVGASSFTALQGNPALSATSTFFINNQDTNFVVYLVVVDMKLVFVKAQKRVYVVEGMAVQGIDRSAIQPFLDSFEFQ